MSTDADLRVSGKTASEEAVEALREGADAPLNPELPEERERSFRFPGFSRMRTDWYGADGNTMRMVEAQVENIINGEFSDLFAIRNELYDLIREPELDDEGEPRRDRFGWVIWRRTDMGYVEDWNKLTRDQMKRFLFQITTRIFEWEESRDRLWAAAMFSKTQWEEGFSTGWKECEIGKKTEGDRTAAGRLESAEERYFAIYATYLSRRAESLVSGMERLAQRIKDVYTQ